MATTLTIYIKYCVNFVIKPNILFKNKLVFVQSEGSDKKKTILCIVKYE